MHHNIQNEPFTAPPPPPDKELSVVTAISMTRSSDNKKDIAKKKLIIANDANNNGIPEKDQNANQTKNHVCQECGKTFVTKASLKVKLLR